MRISRKRNKCYAFRSSAKESQATLCSVMVVIYFFCIISSFSFSIVQTMCFLCEDPEVYLDLCCIFARIEDSVLFVF